MKAFSLKEVPWLAFFAEKKSYGKQTCHCGLCCPMQILAAGNPLSPLITEDVRVG